MIPYMADASTANIIQSSLHLATNDRFPDDGSFVVAEGCAVKPKVITQNVFFKQIAGGFLPFAGLRICDRHADGPEAICVLRNIFAAGIGGQISEDRFSIRQGAGRFVS